jgi:class 3 adenylate cyclase
VGGGAPPGSSPPDGASYYTNVYAVQSVPNPEDVDSLAAQRFRAAFARRAAANGSAASYMALHGYLSTRFAVDVLRRSNGNYSRAHLLDTIFQSRLFPLDDLIFGPFGRGCVGTQTYDTGPCTCYTGARKLFVTEVNTTTGRLVPVNVAEVEVEAAEMFIPMQECELEMGEALGVANTMVQLVDARINDRRLVGVIETMQKSFHTFTSTAAAKLALRSVRYTTARARPDTDASYERLAWRYAAKAIVLSALANATNLNYFTDQAVLVVAPVTRDFALADAAAPPLADWNERQLAMWPTLTDYTQTVVDYAGGSKKLPVHIVGADRAHADLGVAACNSILAPAKSVTLISSGSDAAAVLAGLPLDSNDAAVVVISQALPDLVAAQNFAAAKNVSVFLVCSEHILYDALPLRRKPAAAQPTNDNVFYASGLYKWRVAAHIDASDPAVAYGAVLAALFVSIGAELTTNTSSARFIDAVYEREYMYAIDHIVGPFTRRSCGNAAPLAQRGAACQCSKGFTQFFVRSLLDWAVTDAVPGAVPEAPDKWVTDVSAACGVAHQRAAAAPSWLEANQTSAIVGLCVAAALALCAVAWRCFFAGQTRDNGGAPTDEAAPFAMVFTDIQASTTMWARAPLAMGSAVDLHHQVIRRLIKAHGGYEVKTIGDSFMVAFKDPAAAVKFSLEMQDALFRADWGTDVFDDTYRQLLAAAADARELEDIENGVEPEAPNAMGVKGTGGSAVDLAASRLAARKDTMAGVASQSEDLAPAGSQHAGGGALLPDIVEMNSIAPDAPEAGLANSGGATPEHGVDEHGHSLLPEAGDFTKSEATFANFDAYDAHWRGLRVRVGLHYGVGEIKFDTTTLGYDYYGTVVNTAARVEGVGHGGQVVITGPLYDALLGADGGFAVPGAAVTDMGLQRLRGLDDAVRLVQVLPLEYSDRAFPPLKLDAVISVEKSSNFFGGGDDSAFGEESSDDMSMQSTSDVNGARAPDSERLKRKFARRLLRGSLLHGRCGTAARGVEDALLRDVDLVERLFSAMPPKQRLKAVRVLASTWRVGNETAYDKWKVRLDEDEALLMMMTAKVFDTVASVHSLQSLNPAGHHAGGTPQQRTSLPMMVPVTRGRRASGLVVQSRGMSPQSMSPTALNGKLSGEASIESPKVVRRDPSANSTSALDLSSDAVSAEVPKKVVIQVEADAKTPPKGDGLSGTREYSNENFDK